MMITKRITVLYLIAIFIFLSIAIGWYVNSFLTPNISDTLFDGQRALRDVQTQLSFGPRIPASTGHINIRRWIGYELDQANWQVVVQSGMMLGHEIYNIIARRNDDPPEIILGTHYDTRIVADEDPDPTRKKDPVPGANDGASGVAVLLEIARTLGEDAVPVWLVFFDAEDNGRIEGWDWTLGSQYFVDQLTHDPKGVVIVDMVGDSDLNIYYEKNSNETINKEIWAVATNLGYKNIFIDSAKYSMHDDHTPFLAKGIPAVDIIDFDYPFWHTSRDTFDKVSAESLKAVGETLLAWLNLQK